MELGGARRNLLPDLIRYANDPTVVTSLSLVLCVSFVCTISNFQMHFVILSNYLYYYEKMKKKRMISGNTRITIPPQQAS